MRLASPAPTPWMREQRPLLTKAVYASSKLCDFIYRLVGWVCWEIGLCPPRRSTNQVSYSWGVGRVAELGGLSPILS